MQRIAALTTFADFGRWTPSWLGLANNLRLERYLQRFTPSKPSRSSQRPSPSPPPTSTPASPSTTRVVPSARPYADPAPIPGLFVPIQFEGRTLVDGFLTAPVPVEGTCLLGADITIAVYLEAGSLTAPRTAADVISRSFSIIQRHADLAWRQQADVIIEPDVKPFVWDDFTRTDELIAAGESAAQAAIPEILKAFAADKNRPGLT